MGIGEGLVAIGAALAIGVAALGVALGQGKVGAKALEAMARQPEMASKLQTAMILALGLMEALCIYALLIAFMIIGKI